MALSIGCSIEVHFDVDVWSCAFLRLCCTLVDIVCSDRKIVCWAAFPQVATFRPVMLIRNC